MATVRERVDRLEMLFERFVEEMRMFKEEMRMFKEEMRAHRDKVDEQIREMHRQWGNLARKMGTIVEDIIAPAARPLLRRYFQCEPETVAQRVRRRRGDREIEIDLLAVCDQRVFVFEVRSTPRPRDLDDIRERQALFTEFFPEYAACEIFWIYGSIVVPENIVRAATRRGIFVMAYREWEYVDILNFTDITGQPPPA